MIEARILAYLYRVQYLVVNLIFLCAEYLIPHIYDSYCKISIPKSLCGIFVGLNLFFGDIFGSSFGPGVLFEVLLVICLGSWGRRLPWMSPNLINFIEFGAMTVTKPY